MDSPDISASEWWGRRRLLYNSALVLAGVGAFTAYAAVASFLCAKDADVEITLFSTLVQCMGYAIAMGIANLFYNLGAWAETRCRPREVRTFRIRLLTVGLVFSIVLPYLIPTLLALKCYFSLWD